jgi:hypothetical protein
MKAHLTLTLALLLLCTGAALAQTPDGETPAEETVCDSETGAAFGLCNAYCEAMDCDSDSPQASETACTKVKNKFTNLTGHELPCEAAPSCLTPPPGTICPCAVNSSEFAAAVSQPLQCENLGLSINGTAADGKVVGGGCTNSTGSGGSCFVVNPFGGTFGTNTTTAEGAACYHLILDVCTGG